VRGFQVMAFNGRVALISGVARGQGRSHAVRLAREGATVVGIDSLMQLGSLPLPAADEDDLATTRRLIEGVGGTFRAHVADVRRGAQLQDVVDQTLAEFGQVDVIVANAGVGGELGPSWQATEQDFRDVLDINLVGSWNLARLAVPSMIERGQGSIVFISSGAAVKGLAGLSTYVASKHGFVGLMKTMAKELAVHGIRVNMVQPGNVNTPLLVNDTMLRALSADEPSVDAFAKRAADTSPLGIPWVEPEDVTEAVVWLASDAARYVTGATIAVDGGSAIP